MLLLFTITLSAQDYNLTLLGKLPYPGKSLSGICSYTDSTGKEYVLVGAYDGISIVDISKPSAPVKKFLIPASGKASISFDVKEYKGYAYVVNIEGNGLQIIDLRNLPFTANYSTITPNNMTRGHTVFIDDKGILCINGAPSGTIFLDLNTNPVNPTIIGIYNRHYVHDCFLRNDTFWAACMLGFIDIVSISDKAKIDSQSAVIGTQPTPAEFTHNVWADKTGKHMFTSDEREPSFLTCYDVSDMNNIIETDRTLRNPKAILHNTYWLNDYCISSYYTEGVTIHDVSRKNNMVEVAHYDTSPFSNEGFKGGFGVWPYLPSGNIVLSDMEEGLFIFKPTYNVACYLEGEVSDSVSGAKLFKATIEIPGKNIMDSTNLKGEYATGLVDSGTYAVRFSKDGYAPKTITTTLKNGLLTKVDVQLIPAAPNSIIDPASGMPVNSTDISFNITQSRINKLSIEVQNADTKLPLYIGVYDIAGRVLYSGELQQNNAELELSA